MQSRLFYREMDCPVQCLSALERQSQQPGPVVANPFASAGPQGRSLASAIGSGQAIDMCLKEAPLNKGPLGLPQKKVSTLRLSSDFVGTGGKGVQPTLRTNILWTSHCPPFPWSCREYREKARKHQELPPPRECPRSLGKQAEKTHTHTHALHSEIIACAKVLVEASCPERL